MDAISPIHEIAELDLNDPLFRTDEFMVYGFKVLPCRRTGRHDWRECPFAHPGEVARRRDPRFFNYVGIICPDAKQNTPCPRGERCPYTHSLFEYWLHPTRYKTEFCSRGRRCTRPFCFFAHCENEIRPVDTDALLAATGPPQIPSTLLNQLIQTITPFQQTIDKAPLRDQILSQLGANYLVNARRPLNLEGTSLVLSNVDCTGQSSSPFGPTPQGVLDFNRNTKSFDFGLFEAGEVQNDSKESPSCSENFAERGFSLPTALFK